jgi:hypothetical protein
MADLKTCVNDEMYREEYERFMARHPAPRNEEEREALELAWLWDITGGWDEYEGEQEENLDNGQDNHM